MKTITFCLTTALLLTGCTSPSEPKPDYPENVIYVPPAYAMPAPGYLWMYQENYGWGWYHPNHGWYHGGHPMPPPPAGHPPHGEHMPPPPAHQPPPTWHHMPEVPHG